MPIESDNGAVLAGYTQEIQGVGKIDRDDKPIELYLLVKPGTNLQEAFEAFDTDYQEMVIVSNFGPGR